MKILKRLFFISIMLFVCSCGPIDWLYGVDDKGKDKDGIPPIELFMKVVEQMGPIGTMVVGALTVGGTAYVGHKQGKSKGETRAELAERGLKVVIKGVEEFKEQLPAEKKKEAKAFLKKKIPNEWHPMIDAIRDTL